jgi:hypothetical protein
MTNSHASFLKIVPREKLRYASFARESGESKIALSFLILRQQQFIKSCILFYFFLIVNKKVCE